MSVGDNFKSGQIEIDTDDTAQIIVGIPGNAASLAFKNTSTTNFIYVGHDNTVDDQTGWPLSPGEAISLNILTGNKLWIFGKAADRLAWARVAA